MPAALLFGEFWGFRHLNTFLERRVKLHMQKLEARSKRIFQGEQLWGILHAALRMLRGLVVVFLIYIFANFALSVFPQRRSDQLQHHGPRQGPDPA